MFKRNKFLALLLVSLLALMLLAGCGEKPSEPAGSEDPGKEVGSTPTAEIIKIGTFGPYTGDTASYGLSTRGGVEIAVDEINAAGGINGSEVKLLYEDTRGDQTEAANAVTKLIEQDKVVALVGGVLSHESLTGGPIANDAQVTMISSSSTAAGVPEIGDYIFRNCLSDEVQAIQLAEYAAEELGLEKFAIMFTNNDYGLSLKEAFEKRASELGEVVAVETFNDGESDFGAQLTKIKGKGPEAIYVGGYYTEAAKIAQQAKDRGLDVQFLGADGFYSPVLVELGGEAVEGAVFTAGFFDDDPSDAVQGFVKAYEDKNGAAPDMFAAQAYDAAKILLDAMAGANSTDGPAIQAEMMKTNDFPGITGNTSFTSVGDALKDVIILKVEGGKFIKLR